MRDKLYDSIFARAHGRAGVVGRNQKKAFEDLFLDLTKLLDPGAVLEIGAHDARFAKRVANELVRANVCLLRPTLVCLKGFHKTCHPTSAILIRQ